MRSSGRYLPPGVPGRCWRRSDRRVVAHTPRRHDELVALLVVSGRMRYLIDDQVLVLGSGSLLWAHADQAHFLLSESADFDMWVFVIAPELLQEGPLFPHLCAGDRSPAEGGRLLSARDADALASVARDLRGCEDKAFLTLGLEWWTVRPWAAWQTAKGMTGRQVHPAVQRAAESLRRDPEQSVSAVAREAGLSCSHLSRLYQAATGQSLAAFRTDQRLKRVDAAMAATDAPPLLTAAHDAGFGSYAQFYRAFRAALHTNPRSYYA